MPSLLPAENHCVTGMSCAQKHRPAVYAPNAELTLPTGPEENSGSGSGSDF